jgi:hypothetical protein
MPNSSAWRFTVICLLPNSTNALRSFAAEDFFIVDPRRCRIVAELGDKVYDLALFMPGTATRAVKKFEDIATEYLPARLLITIAPASN